MNEDIEKCPECGNKNLVVYEQIAVARIRSKKTNKVLKHKGFLETTCWNDLCRKCGWSGELKTQ